MPVKLALEDLRGKGLLNSESGSTEVPGLQPSGGFWMEMEEVEW